MKSYITPQVEIISIQAEQPMLANTTDQIPMGKPTDQFDAPVNSFLFDDTEEDQCWVRKIVTGGFYKVVPTSSVNKG